MRIRRRLFLSFVIAGGLCGAGLAIWKATRSGLQLRACFHMDAGLKPATVVRVAGVDAGRVQSVSHQVGDCSVEVKFLLALTPDFQSLPRNATAHIAADGILGPSFLEIDLPKVSGPAIENHGMVQTVEYTPGLNPKAAEKLKKVMNEAIDKATAKPVKSTSGEGVRPTDE
jgi:ABC-type transporter Mla subunit MlaD